jgi:hypothetical protein
MSQHFKSLGVWDSEGHACIREKGRSTLNSHLACVLDEV